MSADEVVERAPHPRLRGLVLGYQGWCATRPMRQRTLPSGVVPLVVNLGRPIQLVDGRAPQRAPRRHGAFVAGLSDAHGFYAYTGPSCGVQANLTPIAARMLLGLPMHHLANHAAELSDVFGAAGERLVAQLDAASSWDQRFDLLDTLFAAQLSEASTAPLDVQWAWRQLEVTHGHVSIGGLAGELGLSRKHLITRFRDQVGLPPKTVARILRFQRAVDCLHHQGDSGLAEIAFTCGYYDQAHLTRDFRQFAGASPGVFLARRIGEVNFVQDGGGGQL